MNSQYGYYQGGSNYGLMSLLKPQSVFWGLGLVLVFLIFFGLLLSKNSSVNLSQRAVAAKPIVPVVQPKAVAPKLVKLDKPEPVMEPKALVAPVAPVEAPQPPVEEAKPVEAAPEAKPVTIDDTFEAYRQAILASGPLQMQEEAHTALQSKNGAANYAAWRDQTTALRNSLKEETAAAFLERTNVSINDRMVAFFDAVKA
jgi:type IV secretory pathway VirB10-like protein